MGVCINLIDPSQTRNVFDDILNATAVNAKGDAKKTLSCKAPALRRPSGTVDEQKAAKDGPIESRAKSPAQPSWTLVRVQERAARPLRRRYAAGPGGEDQGLRNVVHDLDRRFVEIIFVRPSLPRKLSARGFAAGATILASIGQAASQQPLAVELELVLAVDASGSVDVAEFDLQVRGLAKAFRHPDVIRAIHSVGANGIVVALVQWSSPGQQNVAVDWTRVFDATSAARLANLIETSPRQMVDTTAIDKVLLFATQILGTNGFVGRRKAVDVSGDGPTNFGPDPDRMRDRAVAAGITINGLAILNEVPNLDRYYRDHVIGGPGAFIMTATDYRDFGRAIRLKLMREIRGAPTALDLPWQTLKTLVRATHGLSGP